MKRLSAKLAIIIVLAGTAASMATSVWVFRASVQTGLGSAAGVMLPAFQATSSSSSQLINPDETRQDPSVPKDGGVLGLPIAFLIGRDGRINSKHIGATNISVFEREITALLQAK